MPLIIPEKNLRNGFYPPKKTRRKGNAHAMRVNPGKGQIIQALRYVLYALIQ